MGKIVLISLKLNFTPNTLGCYGLILFLRTYSSSFLKFRKNTDFSPQFSSMVLQTQISHNTKPLDLNVTQLEISVQRTPSRHPRGLFDPGGKPRERDCSRGPRLACPTFATSFAVIRSTVCELLRANTASRTHPGPKRL